MRRLFYASLWCGDLDTYKGNAEEPLNYGAIAECYEYEGQVTPLTRVS